MIMMVSVNTNEGLKVTRLLKETLNTREVLLCSNGCNGTCYDRSLWLKINIYCHTLKF